jgi:hypothetical protein
MKPRPLSKVTMIEGDCEVCGCEHQTTREFIRKKSVVSAVEWLKGMLRGRERLTDISSDELIDLVNEAFVAVVKK